MTEVDTQYIAFENDHNYLKTQPSGKEDIQIVQTNISHVGTNNNTHYVLSDLQPTDSQQKTVHATLNKTILSKTLSALKVPNPNAFFIADSLNVSIPLKMNIPPNNSSIQKDDTEIKSTMRLIQSKITNDMKIINTTQAQLNSFLPPTTNTFINQKLLIIPPNNASVQKDNTEIKSTMRLIQPKIANDMKMINTTQAQSNPVLTSSTNTFINPKLLIIRQKKQPEKSTSIVPNILPEKLVVKPIKPKTIKTKPGFRHNIKALKNKLVNNYENGVCTIKLSSSLLERLKNGEKLFTCIKCDNIYTEHNDDLLDHQIVHNNSDEKSIEVETEIREHPNPSENSLDSNLIKCTTIETEKNKNNNNKNINKQTKPTTKITINRKKRNIIFQGECTLCHLVYLDLKKHIRTVHQTHPRDLNKDNINQLNFHCYTCNMEFDDQLQLRAHKLVAHKAINYIYNCEQCCQDFLYKEELEAHIETHHNENKKYLCPYCDAGFPYSNGLKNHLVKHIDLNGFENTTADIATNQIEHRPIKYNKFEKLDQLFADLENISDDCDEVYTEQDVDDEYQVRFATNGVVKSASLPLDSLVDEDNKVDMELNNASLEDNNKTIINQQQIKAVSKKRTGYTVCRLCLMIVSYSKIGNHMKKNHDNAAPYQCDLCHAEFNRKYIMDDHRRKHTNTKPHKCIECSKCFNYRHHLNRHIMTVHKSDSLEKLFKCPVCDKAFLFKEYLTLHNNSCHKGKNYMCQICGKIFATNAALNKHQLCHNDERPYMCEHCGRTFKCKSHYDLHTKKMHPGNPHCLLPPEKFQCKLCNKKFSTTYYRDKHLKNHYGQGHKCDICFKLFVSKAHMQRHIKLLHAN